MRDGDEFLQNLILKMNAQKKPLEKYLGLYFRII